MRRREQRTLCVCGENEAAVAQSEFTLAFQETDIDRPALNATCQSRVTLSLQKEHSSKSRLWATPGGKEPNIRPKNTLLADGHRSRMKSCSPKSTSSSMLHVYSHVLLLLASISHQYRVASPATAKLNTIAHCFPSCHPLDTTMKRTLRPHLDAICGSASCLDGYQAPFLLAWATDCS